MRQAEVWMKSDIHMGAHEGTVHISVFFIRRLSRKILPQKYIAGIYEKQTKNNWFLSYGFKESHN